MKKFALTLCVILFVSFLQFAQDIPNAGFENWTEGEPDNWYTFNVPEIAIPVTQSSTSHSGSSAVRLEIINSIIGPVIPILQSAQNSLFGFPVNERHGSLQGFYQFNPVGNDVIEINVLMIKSGEGYVGSGSLQINNAASAYTQFSVAINYFSSVVPDTGFISFLVVGIDTINVGSFALIDDLSWGGPVGIQEVSNNIPEKFELKQNYPNPFNPSTTIEFSIPEEAFVELRVYDILGKEVAILVNDNYTSGIYKTEFNGDNLPSGIYIARMNTGNFTKSFKMMLLK